MARLLRIAFPGAIYHVTCRMIGDWRTDRARLFKDDADYWRFLDSLAERVEHFHVRLYLFTCMANHFHLVFETPEANCSKFMHSLSTAYTIYYNRRYGRHGPLLDGRYKAKLVEGDAYLLALSRYVHLNPVQTAAMKSKPLAERIKALRAYRWSSYPSFISRRKALDFVEYGPLLAQMPGKRGAWMRQFRAYVESGLAEPDEDLEVALKESPRSIGGAEFRAWVDELYQARMMSSDRVEDVSFRRVMNPLPVAEIMAVMSKELNVAPDVFRQRRRGSPLRALAAQMLTQYGGLTQREAARQLGMKTGGAVSAQLRQLPSLLARDQALKRTMSRIDKMLAARKRDRVIEWEGIYV